MFTLKQKIIVFFFVSIFSMWTHLYVQVLIFCIVFLLYFLLCPCHSFALSMKLADAAKKFRSLPEKCRLI